MTNTDLNFWDDYRFDYLASTKNKIEQWNGPDCEDNFKKVTKNNKFLTYGKDQFFYRRNSYGFRSENFDNNDPVKILYSGCSITEGVGLPVEHTWASFVNGFISKEIGKTPKMYNIGYGGFSIDAITRFTYLTIKNKIFVPDVVLLLLPSITRSEILFQNSYNQIEMYGFITTYDKFTDPIVKNIHSNYLKSFNPLHRLHEAFRNLLFLKLFLDSQNIPFYFYTWDTTKIDFCNNKFLGFGDAMMLNAPKDLREHIIHSEFLQDEGVVLPNFERPFKQNIGRDGMHPGPNSHWNYSKTFYNKLRSREGFKKVMEKWK